MNKPIAIIPNALAANAARDPRATPRSGAPNAGDPAKNASNGPFGGSFALALTTAETRESEAAAQIVDHGEATGPKAHAHGRRKRAVKRGDPEIAAPVASQTVEMNARKELTLSDLGASTLGPKDWARTPGVAKETAALANMPTVANARELATETPALANARAPAKDALTLATETPALVKARVPAKDVRTPAENTPELATETLAFADTRALANAVPVLANTPALASTPARARDALTLAIETPALANATAAASARALVEETLPLALAKGTPGFASAPKIGTPKDESTAVHTPGAEPALHATPEVDHASVVDVARPSAATSPSAPPIAASGAQPQTDTPALSNLGLAVDAPTLGKAIPGPLAARARMVDAGRLDGAMAPIRSVEQELAPRVREREAGKGESPSPFDGVVAQVPMRSFEVRDAASVATVSNDSVKTSEDRQQDVAHATNVMTLRRGFAESDADVAGLGRVHVRAEDGVQTMDVRVTVDRAPAVAMLRAQEVALSAEVSRVAPNAEVRVEHREQAALQRDSREAPQREREHREHEKPAKGDEKTRVRFVL